MCVHKINLIVLTRQGSPTGGKGPSCGEDLGRGPYVQGPEFCAIPL